MLEVWGDEEATVQAWASTFIQLHRHDVGHGGLIVQKLSCHVEHLFYKGKKQQPREVSFLGRVLIVYLETASLESKRTSAYFPSVPVIPKLLSKFSTKLLRITPIFASPLLL